jgi:hypothetical protein
MSATNKSDWYWSDWLGDQEVRRLTPAERGVWIDLIALAAAGSPKGYVCDGQGRPLSLDEIARVTNAGSVDAVAELIKGILEKGAASRDRAGRLFNRRMVRDVESSRKRAAISAKRAAAGHKGGEHTALIYFGKQNLPQQMPRHVSKHLPHVNGYTLPSVNKKNNSSGEAAREARTPPPASEPAERPNGIQGEGWKPPSAMSRAELEAEYAKKRGST